MGTFSSASVVDEEDASIGAISDVSICLCQPPVDPVGEHSRCIRIDIEGDASSFGAECIK